MPQTIPVSLSYLKTKIKGYSKAEALALVADIADDYKAGVLYAEVIMELVMFYHPTLLNEI